MSEKTDICCFPEWCSIIICCSLLSSVVKNGWVSFIYNRDWSANLRSYAASVCRPLLQSQVASRSFSAGRPVKFWLTAIIAILSYNMFRKA
jgi:hypothetical protein